eukprot:3200086-Prymnesium_polylepis.1
MGGGCRGGDGDIPGVSAQKKGTAAQRNRWWGGDESMGWTVRPHLCFVNLQNLELVFRKICTICNIWSSRF